MCIKLLMLLPAEGEDVNYIQYDLQTMLRKMH